MSYICTNVSMVVMISDADILQCFKIDRKQGIQVLFRRYYRPLVLFADEFVHSLSTAEDIVQDFFIRLWTDDYLEKLLPSALPSYLFTSVRNACYTYEHRKDVWNRRRDLPPEVNIAVETALEMDSEVADRINRAISKLPVQTRAVVTRILLEEMKYKDAAAELNISVNTLKTLLRNGLRTLRSELEKDYRSINFAVYLLWNSSAPLVLYD
ncbi:sigma-70 family RNA polymerase sigma factor [Odoribacter splanchnicus]|uniref:sigma-70 family RNA polymerase sigma factor n=1 Tax=Odoribacter splanchnicus TaxID=28118 RepID=UPI0034A7A97C